jgi:hypothetical protein
MVDAVILYPVEIATNLLAHETGYYSADDVRRMGLAMLLLTIVVVSVTILWGCARAAADSITRASKTTVTHNGGDRYA